MQGRLVRRFVGRRNTGELANLPGPGLAVQAFYVSLLTHLERRIDIHLKKTLRPDRLLSPATIIAEGRNHRHQHNQPGPIKQAGDLADPTDILGPILGRKAQIAVETGPQGVAVQAEHVEAGFVQALLQGVGD